MSDDLYQQAIKDLAARESSRLDPADVSVTLDNPLCGDRIVVDARLSGGKVEAVGHAAKGCLLCKAAAAVMADNAAGRDAQGAAELLDGARAMLKQGAEPPLPALAPFLTARPHKSRHDCILLPFKALAKATSP
ncbi:iron-sulfur cluster assembly scaffold protein [Magnetospirillum sp. SS-4]|uniref:iron-sulfur cluster assembly scaffold protein n=1 Tax=Magnetospirillum sp. SS-4 TaxID=2681465 RepID=UPI001384E21F|nr:iron-sulfur cluster assembly scaffold protein [Magnetospirillum sp. SS-4]CAA7625195.1 Fe-S cluster formation NifU-like protein [Magnetospirillum sp. SS-4]